MPDDGALCSLVKVAVVGAGTIGRGLAEDLALHRYEVLLKDRNRSILEEAREKIREDLRLVKLMKPDFRQVPVEEVLDRIHFEDSYDGFSEVDCVVENVTEDFQEKLKVMNELAEVVPAGAFIGVNTSCIPIAELAGAVADPGSLIGMHFMNPVPLSAMVEVIRGKQTSAATLAAALHLVRSLGKDHVVVRDHPGFVSNRIMMLAVNECAFLVQEDVATPGDIDKVFRLGFSHKMGPLATADLIGLDTVLNSIKVLHESFQDPKYRPCPLLTRMVEAGSLGRKSGKGFFDYGKANGGGHGE